MSKQAGDPVAEKFSTYVLPGRTRDPRQAIAQARAAQELGLGGVWISERFATKEPAVLGGLLAHTVPGMRIAGTFYANLRHPIVTASVADLMQTLADGRFSMVLARASEAYFAGYGAPALTFAYIRDSIAIYRALWNGETVDYEGPVGRFSGLRLTDRSALPAPPIIFTAMGPQALALGGSLCDGVLLHPFLTVDAVAGCVAAIRDAAGKAGRDPSSVRIIANVVVAPDLPADERDAVAAARAVTYLQSQVIGPLLARMNGWDPAELDRLRAHPTIARHQGAIVSEKMTRDQLVEAGRSLPGDWMASAAAAGTASHCSDRLCEYLAAGADEILLHGAHPAAMSGMVEMLRCRLA